MQAFGCVSGCVCMRASMRACVRVCMRARVGACKRACVRACVCWCVLSQAILAQEPFWLKLASCDVRLVFGEPVPRPTAAPAMH